MTDRNSSAGAERGDAALEDETVPAAAGFGRSVADGMTQQPKRIDSKWLYDDEGSKLFDAIVASPRYYLGRTEIAILQENAAAIANLLGPDASVIELGSGSSTKVRRLLDALHKPRCYVPIEISEAQLQDAAEEIRRDYPGLTVSPLAADYSKDFALPADVRDGQVMAFFPGSTLCNLLPRHSVEFLRRMGATLGADALFLAGVDLKKDEAVMLGAYNDPGGAIWRFNLNIVDRINRELGAGLDRNDFSHEAIYNREAGRIEAAIYPLKDLAFTIAGQRVALSAGEPIILEYSHKYRIEEFQDLARQAGWEPAQVWTDPDELFSVHLLRNTPG